jgi:hypothetical protein
MACGVNWNLAKKRKKNITKYEEDNVKCELGCNKVVGTILTWHVRPFHFVSNKHVFGAFLKEKLYFN